MNDCTRTFRYSIFVFLLAFSAERAIAADDEAVDLRGPAPKKGHIVHEVANFKLENADFTLTQGDNKLEAKMSIDSQTDKEVEILGVDGRNIVKLKTRITKDSADRTTTVMGQTQKMKETKELEGQVVISELKKKMWTHELDDAKPNEKQVKELKNFDEPENDDDLYPAEKVKVGHSWNIEPSAFKKLLGSKFSEAKGKGKSKFVKIVKVGDELCAVIESEIDLTGKIKDDDGNDISIEIKGKLVNHRSIALGMDIKFTIEGDGVFSGKIDADGQKADVRFAGKISSSGTATVTKR